MLTQSDKDLFLALLLPLRSRLDRYTRAMTRDMEEARDLLGDTILIALRQFPRLVSHAAFPAWLFTIASRLNARRRRRRERWLPLDDLLLDTLADPAASPEQHTDIERLRRALAELPPAQRDAVTLFDLAGLRLEEIQAMQGGSLSAVKMRLLRGRARLAHLLGVDDDISSPASPDRLPATPTGESR